jgi:predicted nuclease of predicted toxin-antitoxin system
LKILEVPLLLDENVPEALGAALEASGRDVTTARATGLRGVDDSAVIKAAAEAQRIVVTQDRDFGRLAMRHGMRCPGIVFLRPGNQKPEVLLEMLQALAALDAPSVPFVAVIRRRPGTQVARLRLLSTV